MGNEVAESDPMAGHGEVGLEGSPDSVARYRSQAGSIGTSTSLERHVHNANKHLARGICTC